MIAICIIFFSGLHTSFAGASGDAHINPNIIAHIHSIIASEQLNIEKGKRFFLSSILDKEVFVQLLGHWSDGEGQMDFLLQFNWEQPFQYRSAWKSNQTHFENESHKNELKYIFLEIDSRDFFNEDQRSSARVFLTNRDSEPNKTSQCFATLIESHMPVDCLFG